MASMIRRRDFLILGSAGVASTLALGGVSLAARRDESAGVSPVSVGYWRGSEGRPANDPFHADVIGAAEVRTGDRAFGRNPSWTCCRCSQPLACPGLSGTG
jgi:hypothetical protein